MNPFSYWTSLPAVAFFISLRWLRKFTEPADPVSWQTFDELLLVGIAGAAALSCISFFISGYQRINALHWWRWTEQPSSLTGGAKIKAYLSNCVFIGMTTGFYSSIAMIITMNEGLGGMAALLAMGSIEGMRRRIEEKRLLEREASHAGSPVSMHP